MGGGSSSTQTAWSRDPAVSKLPVLKLGNHMAVSVIITGAIDSVLDKLMGLPGDEHRLDVKLGIQYLEDELSIMRAVLLRLSETEEHAMDPQSKEWRDRVQDMSFDIENCIDRFMLRRSHGSSDGGPVEEAVGILKSVRDDLNAGKEIQAMVAEESERRSHAPATAAADMHPLPPPHVPLDPRVHTPYEAARNLVGIDTPRKNIFGWLAEEDTKPNVVAIFGIGGSGKTTLALEVYNKIHEEMAFDCRAFVSVSQTPDIKSVFKQLLFQVNKHVFYASEMWDLEQLILKLREELQDKRYLIVIDDISCPLVWKYVKSVLPIDNNERSRIIATTRIEGLARSCCADMSGHMYEAKLLTDDDSRSLFFRRIFPSSECCPQELSKLADEILKKCGGLPLAIISISSLLASKSRTMEVWLRILNSISSAIEKDGPFDKMQRILFLCYFDLEPLLRVCLLYLSVFPEDYYIDSRFLIWRWMAEGLLPGENGEDMWKLGESYLNQLINRSMIQARKIGENGTTVKFCGVHDIVLDFITSQAVEHNFVTVLKDDEYPSKKIRWLSLHLHSSEVADLPIKDASPLRSIHMFGPVGTVSRGKKLPQNCEALRVLNIEGIIKFNNCDIQHIGCFYQLKYLRIVGEEEHTPRVRAWDCRINEQVTTITELPKQIGNLHNLEVLDLRGLGLIKLPATVVRLKKLVCLFLNGVFDPLPDGMENLQCLEELSRINLCEASMRSVQGLGGLRRLRRLEITWELFGRSKKDHMKACGTSLSKLVAKSLHSLHFSEFEHSNFLNYWVFPSGSSPPLRRLILRGADNFGFPAIPRQISSLINLTRLRLSRVCQMGEQGVNILGSLPMLLSLTLSLGYSVRQCHVISCQGFQRLMKLHFSGETCLMFEPGAMPKLQRMKLVLSRSDQYLPGGFVEGLLHLSSLKHISIRVCCLITDRSVEDLMDEIRRTTSIHPNHPILDRI